MAGYRGQSLSEEIQLKSRGKGGRSARIIQLLIAGSRVSRKRAALMRLQTEKFAGIFDVSDADFFYRSVLSFLLSFFFLVTVGERYCHQ